MDYDFCNELLKEAYDKLKKGVEMGDKLCEELEAIIDDLNDTKINQASFNNKVKRFRKKAKYVSSNFFWADLLLRDASRKSKPPDNVIVLKVDRQRKLFPE